MNNGIALLFFGRRSGGFRYIPTASVGDLRSQREKMKQILKLSAAPAIGLLALAMTSLATPAAAAKYEYCRTDVSSAMRSCSFTSLEECQVMSAGRGGTCARDPFLPASDNGGASNAYAYQPKGGLHRAKRPAAHP
jgi:hypothetical protein